MRADARPAADHRARPRPHDPARARAHLEPPERHRRRLRRRRPRRREQRFAALTERARRLNEPAHRAPLPVRLDRTSAAARLASTPTVARRTRRNSARSRAESQSGWRELALQHLVPGPPARHRRRHAPRTPSRSAPSGRRHAPAASPRTHEPTSPRLAYNGFTPVAPRRAAGDVQARLEQRAVELLQTLRPARRAPRPARRACRMRAGARTAARSASAASKARAAPRSASSNRRRPRRASAPAHRLLRQLARRRPRRSRQPAARLPADQQELRALLRLRRPLMLTLLRDLRRLRRQIALPAPDRGRSLAIRHVDAGSCNGCEHELDTRRRPLLRPRSASDSASSPPPATPTSCSSPAPSRPACANHSSPPTTPCPNHAASSPSATAPSAAACSASPELAGAVETCCRSTSASPAARLHPKPSQPP